MVVEHAATRDPLQLRGTAHSNTALWLSLAILALLACWQAIVSINHYPAFVLPSPLLVAERLFAELRGPTLLYHTSVTLTAALGGFLLSLGVALVLGYLLAQLPLLDRVVTPLLAASQAVPVIAVAPLIILWVGVGAGARVLIAAIITFFPMLIATLAALRAVPRELIEMARINGATRGQLITLVELPLATTGIFTGIRAGLALATTGAVVGEFVGGRDGLGALINIARGLFDTPLIFVALLMLALLTLGLSLAAAALQRLLTRWEYE